MTLTLQNQTRLQKIQIWMICNRFSQKIVSPEFMVGGCAHIAVVSTAHTHHMSEVWCAEERQKRATESTIKRKKKSHYVSACIHP